MTFTFRVNIREALKDLNLAKKKIDTKLIDVARDAVGEYGVKQLKKTAPVSRSESTGMHLRDSFYYKRTRKNLVSFYSKVEYAVMVSRGTKPSKGGYIPKLGVRLKKRTINRRNIQSPKLKKHPGIRPNKYIEKAGVIINSKVRRVIIRALASHGITRNNKL